MGVQTQIPDPKNGLSDSIKTIPSLVTSLGNYLRIIQQQMNRLSNGSINGINNAATTPPPQNSTQSYTQGDYIRNSAPSVRGAAGSQYVVSGWICTEGGAPGTWVECRYLTGT